MGFKFNPFTGTFDIAGTSGDVSSSINSTNDNRVARFDSTTGKLIQDSPATIADNGNFYSPNATYTSSMNIGESNTLSGDKTFIYGKLCTVGQWSTVVGWTINASTNQRVTGVGYNQTLSGTGATAYGYQASAAGSSTAIGYQATATATASTCLGINASSTSGNGNIAIGQSASAGNAIGNSTAVGVSSSCSGVQSFSLGNLASCSGSYAFAIGASSSVQANYGLAIGTAATVGTGHLASICLGQGATSTTGAQLVIGGTYAGGGGITSIYIGTGVTNTTTYDFTFTGTGASGTDTAAKDIYFDARKGTGTQSSGKIIWRSGLGGSTGTSLNSVSRKMQLAPNGITYRSPITTKTSSYTLTEDDSTVLFDCSSGACTATLPSASSSTGVKFNIKLIDATNNLTIDANGSETIDGATTKTLTIQYESVTLHCDGAAWWVV